MMADNRQLHMVPHFHYDTVYLQTYDSYLQQALDLMHEAVAILTAHENYTFMIEQMILLEEYWIRFPDKRSLLQQLAQEGRLEVACGMYCMPDLNIPSGEAMIRQAVIGKRWIKKHLGIEVKMAWMPDSFGHHLQIPQLMKHCGYEGYFFGRGARSPGHTPFIWIGIDGTRLLSHRLEGGYGLVMFSDDVQNKLEQSSNGEQDAAAIQAELERLAAVSDSRHLLLPNGGDMARPQWEAVAAVQQFNNQSRSHFCSFSTVRQFAKEIVQENLPLPEIQLELNPVFQGCYSSRMQIKLWNRNLEWKLQLAERLYAVLFLRSVVPADIQDSYGRWLESAWKHVLFNQFHDIICGTILDEGYRETLIRYETADRLLENALSVLQSCFPVTGRSGSTVQCPVLHVFNPSAFLRKGEVSFALNLSDLPWQEGTVLVQDNQGNILNAEISSPEAEQLQVTLTDSFPGLTLRQYTFVNDSWRQARQPDPAYTVVETSTGIRVVHSKLALEVTPSGGICSLRYVDDGCKEWVAQGGEWNELVLLSDTGDFWLYDEPILNGAFFGQTPENGLLKMEDSYPYSRKTLSRSSGATSRLNIVQKQPNQLVLESSGELRFWKISVSFTKKVIIDFTELCIRFETRLHCSGEQYRVAALFPTTLQEGKHLQQIPYGAAVREEGEFPAQTWAALTTGKRGLLLANKGIPGNGKAGDTLYLALMRSTAMRYKVDSELGYERGSEFCFSYDVIPFFNRNLDELRPDRRGEQLNLPLLSATAAGDNGASASASASAWTGPVLEGQGIELAAFYRSDEGWVIRVYNSTSQHSHGRLRCAFPQGSQSSETDAMGQPTGEKREWQGELELFMGPFQIKTIMVASQQKRGDK
ncbi:glycosyl hydrolase-related protein [Paenibacillus sp. N3.4]|uniref:glycoside hydrolase family 38 N-terminal domain-containing protein n=1 Tax=Paenibacillus sp. N3.4 TaxID=2603222 RepID=UPI0011CA8231|nr:glycosyl hydrolase-related protein [Paenibacillus sp. N3.4]TXK84466.1 hypothetical protein FU659_08595 [Paenibacillus sp. N3.4]